MNNCDIDVRYRSVVSEAAAIPIAAVVAATRVSKAVIDSAIKADMVTPIAAMPAIAAFIEIPIGRRP
jgi:hypothetical protein